MPCECVSTDGLEEPDISRVLEAPSTRHQYRRILSLRFASQPFWSDPGADRCGLRRGAAHSPADTWKGAGNFARDGGEVVQVVNVMRHAFRLPSKLRAVAQHTLLQSAP